MSIEPNKTVSNYLNSPTYLELPGGGSPIDLVNDMVLKILLESDPKVRIETSLLSNLWRTHTIARLEATVYNEVSDYISSLKDCISELILNENPELSEFFVYDDTAQDVGNQGLQDCLTSLDDLHNTIGQWATDLEEMGDREPSDLKLIIQDHLARIGEDLHSALNNLTQLDRNSLEMISIPACLDPFLNMGQLENVDLIARLLDLGAFGSAKEAFYQLADDQVKENAFLLLIQAYVNCGYFGSAEDLIFEQIAIAGGAHAMSSIFSCYLNADAQQEVESLLDLLNERNPELKNQALSSLYNICCYTPNIREDFHEKLIYEIRSNIEEDLAHIYGLECEFEHQLQNKVFEAEGIIFSWKTLLGESADQIFKEVLIPEDVVVLEKFKSALLLENKIEKNNKLKTLVNECLDLGAMELATHIASDMCFDTFDQYDRASMLEKICRKYCQLERPEKAVEVNEKIHGYHRGTKSCLYFTILKCFLDQNEPEKAKAQLDKMENYWKAKSYKELAKYYRGVDAEKADNLSQRAHSLKNTRW